MIKAILLDIDDTILDWDLCSHYAIKMAAEELNISLPDSIYSVYDRINPTLWQEHEKGLLPMDELFKKRFNTIFKEVNVSFDGEVFEKYFRKYILDSHIFVEGAYSLLEYLYSKYDVYAASNSTLYQQQRRIARAGILDYFTDIFVSEEIGYHKPKGEFYDGCLKRMHASKDEIIVIGDSLSSDIKGAYNYGLKSIWFNKKKIKDDSKMYDYMVYDLAEIKKIL